MKSHDLELFRCVGITRVPASWRARPWAALLALLLLAAAALPRAQAQPLPAAGPYYGVGIEGFGSDEALSFGSLTKTNEFGSATAIVGTNPRPFVSLTVQSSDASLGAHDTSAFGQLGYYVRVGGPAGVQVPVWVTASGNITYSDSNANLNGSLKITRQFFSTPLVDEQMCHHSLFCGTNFRDSFALNQKEFLFESGAQYYVSLVAQATAMTNGGGSGHATVFLDPYFEIAPTFVNAGAFSLEFSPGIVQSPVPEPATLSMWLMALGLSGAAGLRRRRRP
ncbi:MAG: PEP-CTERM sorting domain-containing protein [Burkholderiales bacterium]|nr:PEP-CTERM sorting domain-containing protein [Burkholderiales bacterium]